MYFLVQEHSAVRNNFIYLSACSTNSEVYFSTRVQCSTTVETFSVQEYSAAQQYSTKYSPTVKYISVQEYSAVQQYNTEYSPTMHCWRPPGKSAGCLCSGQPREPDIDRYGHWLQTLYVPFLFGCLLVHCLFVCFLAAKGALSLGIDRY